MTKVFRTEDGARYVVDIQKDTALYKAPENPPNTGSRYTSGIDLYVHETAHHGPQFYKYHWSMWQGSEDYYVPVSKEEATQFLEDMTGDYNDFPDADDVELCAKFGIKLLEETA